MTNPTRDEPVMTRKRWFRYLALWALGIGLACLLTGLGIATWVAPASADPFVRVLFPMASVCLVCGLLWLVMTPWISDDLLDRAHRRYMRQVLPAFVGYVLAMALLALTRDADLPTWCRALLALLPVLPIAWVVWAMWDYIQHCDELERRVQIEATYLTCGIVGVLTFAGGMLQNMGVLALKGALVNVLPLMFVVYGVAGWWCRRKYGLKGMC